jgi:hypothetical protein
MEAVDYTSWFDILDSLQWVNFKYKQVVVSTSNKEFETLEQEAEHGIIISLKRAD